MPKSRKCKLSDIEAWSWLIMDGEVCQKDDFGCCIRFSDGAILFSENDYDLNPTVKFVKSVELIYD